MARGYHLLGGYAAQTGIPVGRAGAVLVAWTAEELQALPALKDKAGRNGYHDCPVIGAAEVYRQLPDVGPGALGGLTVPGQSIICTCTTNLALATDAVHRGATLLREHAVTGADVSDGISAVHTSRGDVTGRWVINAAGTSEAGFDFLLGKGRTLMPASWPRE